MMMFGMVLLWAVIIALAIGGVRWLFPSRTRSISSGEADRDARGPDATEILASRYARGEISGEQYRLMRSDLESPHKASRRSKGDSQAEPMEEIDSPWTPQA